VEIRVGDVEQVTWVSNHKEAVVEIELRSAVRGGVR